MAKQYGGHSAWPQARFCFYFRKKKVNHESARINTNERKPALVILFV